MKRKLIGSLILTILLTTNILMPEVKVYADNISNPQYVSQANYNNYSELNKKIKEKAQYLLGKQNTVSVQYAVSDGDNIIVSDNVKAEDKNTYVDNNTMYNVASVSKMFTTTAVMQLVDEGKVDLDMPVTTYIKDFKMEDEKYKDITVRMLLNHSSGLMGTAYGNIALMDEEDTSNHDSFLETLSHEKLKAKPGEFSVYCNDGFTLAEILVERVSGMNFTDYIREKISKPLNLTNTKTPFDNFDKNKMADTFSYSKDVKDPHEEMMAIGAAGVISTAEDLCKFQRGISRKDGQGIISTKSFEAMQSKEYLKGVWVTDGEDCLFNFGLGWDNVNVFPLSRYNIKAIVKGGDSYTSHASIVTLPDYDISVAVTSSGGSSVNNEMLAVSAIMEVLKSKNILSEKDILPNVNFKSEFSQCMPIELKNKYNGYYMGKGTNGVACLYYADINPNGELALKILDAKDKMYPIGTFKHTYSGYFMPVEQNPKYQTGFRFVDEKNGKVYLEEKIYTSDDVLGESADSGYIAEKVELSGNALEKSWENRNKDYYLINQKYSYWLNPVLMSSNFQIYKNNFIEYNRILPNDNTEVFLSLPGNLGRDLNEYKFTTENGIEYVNVDTRKFMKEESIPLISKEVKEVKIDEDGYAKWFFVPESLNNSKITVKSNKKSSFNVYLKSNKNCILDSYLENRNKEDKFTSTCNLNSDEALCFLGNPGETFEVTIE